LDLEDPRLLRPLLSQYDNLATPKFIQAARTAVKEMADRLQGSAFTLFPGKIFGDIAFSGVLGIYGSSVSK
jgi:hypothetical protein